ncbi:MAG: hypothetical protein S4CHLAM102_12300 [Chlamydiia bacterium]|nr:hypothetical protein [Chlamydiia bacterium]
MAIITFRHTGVSAPDEYEVASNLLLGPLSTAIGRTYQINRIEGDYVEYEVGQFAEVIDRVVGALFALVILPATLLGLALMACSSTYGSLLYKINLTRAGIAEPAVYPFSGNSRALDLVEFRKDASELSREQVKEKLVDLEKGVNRNPIQMQREDAPKFDHNQFNLDLFRTMHQRGFQTPLDFCLGFSGFNAPSEPMAQVWNPEVVVLPDECFFEFNWDNEVREFSENRLTSRAFGMAFRKEGNVLYAFLDGISQGMTLRVNEQVYPYLYGKGTKHPSIKLYPGDHLFASRFYLGRVNAAGNLERPSGDPGVLWRIDEEGKVQSEEFLSKLCAKNRDDVPEQLEFTHLRVAAELPGPIERGFVVPNSYSPDYFKALENQKRDVLMMHDPDLDPVFNQVVDYFQNEQREFGFSDSEMVLRVSSFLKYAFTGTPGRVDKLTLATFGDCLNARKGVCRHYAFFLKGILDELKIESTVITGAVRRSIPIWSRDQLVGWAYANEEAGACLSAGHAWNGVVLNGEKWIIDPSAGLAFRIDAVPGEDEEAKKRLRVYYGL